MSTTRFITSLVSLAAAASTVLALAGPADAQIKTHKDPRGDARPAIDVTNAKYRNRGRYLTARLKVRDLRWHGDFQLELWNVDPEENVEIVDLLAHRDHTVDVSAFRENRGGSWKLKCPDGVRARYRAKKDVVTFRVHRSCIPDIKQHPTVFFQVDTYMGNAIGKHHDGIGGGYVKHN